MPIKSISKFDSGIFYGDWDNWGGFNKQKYTKEQAIEAWKNDMFDIGDDTPYVVEGAFVRWRAGQTEDHEPCVGWWLEWEDYGNRSVPAWSIRETKNWEILR